MDGECRLVSRPQGALGVLSFTVTFADLSPPRAVSRSKTEFERRPALISVLVILSWLTCFLPLSYSNLCGGVPIPWATSAALGRAGDNRLQPGLVGVVDLG